ncbi:MAG: peptidase S9, partial [Novosphingobium sp. 35-62-5]
MKTNSLLSAAALAVAFAAPAVAQQAAPLSPQDLVTLSRLGGSAISSDGKLVAYVVTTTDPVSYKRTPALWARSADGKDAPRRIDTGGSVSDPAFGPDGALYYLSDRKVGEAETTQVWKVDPASGVTTQVTAFKTEVAGFELSPNGKRIAVWGDIARTCPTFGCESDGNTAQPGPGTGRHYKDGAGFVRHWDAWETPGNYSRVFAFDLGADGKASGEGQAADGPVGTLTGDSPNKPFGGGEDVAWAADSQSLFFVARQADRNEPTSTNLDIWHSKLDGGAPTNLTEANKATDNTPAPSSDGK